MKKIFCKKSLVYVTFCLFVMVSIIPSLYASDAQPLGPMDNDWDFTSNPPHMFSMNFGNIGIGTSNPDSKLHIYATTPKIKLENIFGHTSEIEKRVWGLKITDKKNGSGDSLISIDPYPSDGTSNAVLRFFRSTNTIGEKYVDFYKGDNTATRHARIGVDGTDSFFAIGDGDVGIGTASPDAKLHLYGTAPSIKIENDLGDSSEIEKRTWGLKITDNKESSGDSLISIDPYPSDGTSNAVLRFFRSTNTIGQKYVDFYKGDNTATRHARIGVDGTDSFFAIGDGDVGIGTTTPSAKLDVSGSLYVDDDISMSSKTRYLSIPPAAFTPSEDGYNYFNSGHSIESNEGDTQYYFVAPVFLPHGAVVEKITYYFLDYTCDFNSYLYLRRANFEYEYTNMAQCQSSGCSGYGSDTDSTINLPTINNHDFQYYLWLDIHDWNTFCMGIVIEYTVTNPYP